MSKLKIKTKERRFETARDLYGIFFEDINRAGDGGLYPEMLRNRSFEDSVLPEGYIQQEDGSLSASEELSLINCCAAFLIAPFVFCII